MDNLILYKVDVNEQDLHKYSSHIDQPNTCIKMDADTKTHTRAYTYAHIHTYACAPTYAHAH